ncbi:MAG: LysR family transcriptional regulator [Stappiaceae bacterium]
MNWDDVRIFLAVARTGQILAGSRRLGINHATVSRRLTALEKSLNTQLVSRRTNGTDLTEAGEEFLLAAERMETEMFSVQARIGESDISVSGTVRIGAPDGFGIAFLASRLGELTRKFPNLTIQLVPVPRSFSISRREADIAITVERPAHGRLVARKLVDYTLALYASKNYLESAGTPETVEELTNHDLIGYVEDLIFSAPLNYAQQIDKNWQARFECSSALGQTEAVRAGDGIGVLHSFIAQRDPGLVRILGDIILRRAYWIVFHENTRNLGRIKAVSDYIHTLVDQERSIFSENVLIDHDH